MKFSRKMNVLVKDKVNSGGHCRLEVWWNDGSWDPGSCQQLDFPALWDFCVCLNLCYDSSRSNPEYMRNKPDALILWDKSFKVVEGQMLVNYEVQMGMGEGDGVRGSTMWRWVIESPPEHSWLIGTAWISRPPLERQLFADNHVPINTWNSPKCYRERLWWSPKSHWSKEKLLYLLCRKACERRHSQSPSSGIGAFGQDLASGQRGYHEPERPWKANSMSSFYWRFSCRAVGSSPFGQISLIQFLDSFKFRSLMWAWTESKFILVSCPRRHDLIVTHFLMGLPQSVQLSFATQQTLTIGLRG